MLLAILADGISVDWIQLLQTFGLAVVILFFIGIGVWKMARWSASELAIPLRDLLVQRILSFFHKVEETVAKVDVNVDKMTKNLNEQTVALQRIEQKTDHALTIIAKNHTEAMNQINHADQPAPRRRSPETHA